MTHNVLQVLLNPMSDESSIEVYLDFEIISEGVNQETGHVMNEYNIETSVGV